MTGSVPVVPVQHTRNSAYRLLLDVLAAAGADRVEGYIDLSPGPCHSGEGEGTGDRHRITDGYYTLGVLANIAVPDGAQHETFARLREFARGRGDDIAAYTNPPNGTPRGAWRLSASVPGDHGQRYGFTVFVAEHPGWTLVAAGPNGCRRHPGPPADLGPYSLPALVPTLPAHAPIWTPAPPPPAASPAPTQRPADAPAAQGTTLAHITDALG